MKYKLISTRMDGAAGEKITTYGIDGPAGRIEDISFARRELGAIVRSMNRLKLEPVHAADVVEDFLLRNCNCLPDRR